MNKPIPDIKDLSKEQIKELKEKGRITIKGEVLKLTPYLECEHRNAKGELINRF